MRFSMIIYLPLACFTLSAALWDYDSDESGLLRVCGEFKRVKAKLSKEVYSFAFGLICEKLIDFYICL